MISIAELYKTGCSGYSSILCSSTINAQPCKNDVEMAKTYLSGCELIQQPLVSQHTTGANLLLTHEARAIAVGAAKGTSARFEVLIKLGK